MYGPTSVFLPGGRFAAACQLGDRLGQLPELRADLAVVVGPGARPGRQWTAVAGRADRAPFRDETFDLIAVDNPPGSGNRWNPCCRRPDGCAGRPDRC
jgi:hypothetical protein